MSYTQNNEEQIILDYFKGYVGTFCSLGENDGITFSNVRALAERGWSGVMIEPDPSAFEKLEKLYQGYKGLYAYNYAISSHNGKKILQASSSLLKKGDTGLVSTFSSSEMERFKSVVSYSPIEVKVYTWGTARNRWQIRDFDFISADCEGSEMDFLPDMDLTKTKLICLEHNGSNDVKKQYLECTSRYGLDKIIYESPENIIICRK
jgi:FkbM family methyltransferase